MRKLKDLWESVGDFVICFLAIVGIFCLGVSVLVGGYVANSEWICHSWHNATGDTTQLIAGDCYVKDKDKDNRFEPYDAYVNYHHVNMKVSK